MGLAERQRFARVGNDAARDRDDYSAWVALDRDRMIRPGILIGFACAWTFCSIVITFGCRVAPDYVADLPGSVGGMTAVDVEDMAGDE
jgi:hypothetical protein